MTKNRKCIGCNRPVAECTGQFRLCVRRQDERVPLNDLIGEFLKVRRLAEGGGYAKVEPQDVEQLYAIIQALIELKFDDDADGDFPIQFKLIDRTRYESMPFVPVPYDHKPDTREQFMTAFELHFMNWQMASGRVDTILKLESFRKSQEQKVEPGTPPKD